LSHSAAANFLSGDDQTLTDSWGRTLLGVLSAGLLEALFINKN